MASADSSQTARPVVGHNRLPTGSSHTSGCTSSERKDPRAGLSRGLSASERERNIALLWTSIQQLSQANYESKAAQKQEAEEIAELQAELKRCLSLLQAQDTLMQEMRKEIEKLKASQAQTTTQCEALQEQVTKMTRIGQTALQNRDVTIATMERDFLRLQEVQSRSSTKWQALVASTTRQAKKCRSLLCARDVTIANLKDDVRKLQTRRAAYRAHGARTHDSADSGSNELPTASGSDLARRSESLPRYVKESSEVTVHESAPTALDAVQQLSDSDAEQGTLTKCQEELAITAPKVEASGFKLDKVVQEVSRLRSAIDILAILRTSPPQDEKWISQIARLATSSEASVSAIQRLQAGYSVDGPLRGLGERINAFEVSSEAQAKKLVDLERQICQTADAVRQSDQLHWQLWDAFRALTVCSIEARSAGQ